MNYWHLGPLVLFLPLGQLFNIFITRFQVDSTLPLNVLRVIYIFQILVWNIWKEKTLRVWIYEVIALFFIFISASVYG